MKRLALLTISLCIVGWNAPVRAQGNPVKRLENQVAALQKQVNTLQTTVNTLQTQLSGTAARNAFALGKYVSVDPNTENGVAGPNVVFKAVNVHIVSGSGRTLDSTALGNLIVGYNSTSTNLPNTICIQTNPNPIEANRTGSHNFIVGDCHQFTSSGGFVAGLNGTVSGPFANVSGGFENTASGGFASVSGGIDNTASALNSSVSGGNENTASGVSSSVSGGEGNLAVAEASSVSGGSDNTASATDSSVSGGKVNTASGHASSVSGIRKVAKTKLQRQRGH